MAKISKRPNILCFITDQQRHDHLGCMNNQIVQTPNIDAIAKRGMTFERFYVSNPLCMPARATYFTGRTPRTHGLRTNGIPLSKDIPTLPGALSEAGYITQAIGKLHLNTFNIPKGSDPEKVNPNDYPESYLWRTGKVKNIPTPYYGLQGVKFVGGHGYSVFGDYINWLEHHYPGMKERLLPENALEPPTGAPQCYKMSIPEELHYNHWIADKAIEFLATKKEQGKPFFLWCSFPDPHHPYATPEPWCHMYKPKDIPFSVARKEGELDELPWFYKKIYEEPIPISGFGNIRGGRKSVAEYMPHLKEMIALTYGMISFVDYEIGRVMKKLEEFDLIDNTIITFMSDHGDMMGDHWMVKKGPFHFEGLLRIPFIWSWPGHILEGIKTQGLGSQIDFAPTVLDLCQIPIPEGIVPKEPVAPMMCEPWPGKSLKEQLEGKKTSVNDWVIVENDEDHLGIKVRSFITDRYKLTLYAGKPYGEFFDLQEDPNELQNQWNNPEYEGLIKDLKCRFLDAYILQDTVLPRRLGHA